MTRVVVIDIELAPIPEHKGFFISKCGRVFKEPTKKVGRNAHGPIEFMTKWVEYKPVFAEYPQVSLSVNGKKTTRKVHRLLAMTYLPNPESLPQVNHINGDKHDYRLENLEWSTASENVRHSYNTGLASNLGSKHPRSILDEEQVRSIKFLIKECGATNYELAETFMVHHSTISKIRRGKLWGHVHLE